MLARLRRREGRLRSPQRVAQVRHVVHGPLVLSRDEHDAAVGLRIGLGELAPRLVRGDAVRLHRDRAAEDRAEDEPDSNAERRHADEERDRKAQREHEDDRHDLGRILQARPIALDDRVHESPCGCDKHLHVHINVTWTVL